MICGTNDTVVQNPAAVTWLITVIFASRTGNPCGSVTRPINVDVFTCATELGVITIPTKNTANAHTTTNAHKLSLRII
jgi:hypothetical protein